MSITRAEPGKTRVGWIGTGVMGRWMCQHLMTKGYQATVYNRSRDKASPLLEAGAAWADSPRAVAERADVVFAIVGFPRDVREVFLGPQGALAGSRPGTVLVWRGTNGVVLHAAVTIGAGWAFSKPSQSWCSPRVVWTVRDTIRVNRHPGELLHRYRVTS